jgi:hypothetical protein
VRVHLAGEHALELQCLDATGVTLDVLDHRRGGVRVVLGLGQVEQLVRAAQTFQQLADAIDHLVQRGTLTAQALGEVRRVPDVRVL